VSRWNTASIQSSSNGNHKNNRLMRIGTPLKPLRRKLSTGRKTRQKNGRTSLLPKELKVLKQMMIQILTIKKKPNLNSNVKIFGNKKTIKGAWTSS